MDKKVNIKSPIGVVHSGYLVYKADSPKDSNLYHPLCKYKKYIKWDDGWQETNEPITCKECFKLLLLDKVKSRDYELSILQGANLMRVEASTKDNIMKALVMQGFISDVLWIDNKKQITLIMKGK